MTILIVDDDPISVLITKKLIEHFRMGHQTSTAANGKEALEIFSKCKTNSTKMPDVIFLDLDMPIMNGFEFLETLQLQYRSEINNVNVIILTSSIDPNDIKRAEQFGVSNFLNKPITEGKLHSVLKFG